MNQPPRSEPVVEHIDSACMRAAAEGDTASFESLVDRWQTRLLGFFYRQLGNRVDAEDLTQETFVHLYRALPRYESRNTFNAYLFTLARRRLIDHQRRRARIPRRRRGSNLLLLFDRLLLGLKPGFSRFGWLCSGL